MRRPWGNVTDSVLLLAGVAVQRETPAVLFKGEASWHLQLTLGRLCTEK